MVHDYDICNECGDIQHYDRMIFCNKCEYHFCDQCLNYNDEYNEEFIDNDNYKKILCLYCSDESKERRYLMKVKKCLVHDKL